MIASPAHRSPHILLAVLACCALSAPPLRGQPLSGAEQQAISEAIAQASPWVVQLQVIGGPDRVDNVTLASGPATGVLLTPDGYVVTSQYRFDPAPATVIALLADGRQFATQIVATDHSRKLVLLRLVGGEDLPIAEPAPTDSYRVGQWAIALGRTYRADRANVAVGILSAVDRIQGRALQTDAAVSAANYGGPLVDIEGRVLGILSPMSPSSERSIAGVEWYDSGIGFAIPLAPWLSAVQRLKEGDDLELGYVGVQFAEGEAKETPPKVASTLPDSPAAKAGLAAGDLITAIDGRPVATQTQMQFAIKPHYAGDTIEIEFERDSRRQTTKLTLVTIAELDEAAKAADKKTSDEDQSARSTEPDIESDTADKPAAE